MKNLYIFGTGRWAKEVISSLQHLKNIKINIISKKEHIKKWIFNKKYKNIFFLKSLPNLKKKKLDSFVLVLSLVHNHYANIKESIKKNYDKIFVEKPLVKTKKQINFLNKHKNKIFCSRIFSYDEVFKSVFKSINNSKIISLKIIWKDSLTESRRNLKKIHDKSIKYSFDIMPHILNILDLIFNSKKTKPVDFNIEYNLNDKALFNFRLNNVKVICELNRNSKRSRVLLINFINKTFIFNFTNNKKYILKEIEKNNIKKRVFKITSSNLKNMILSFIGSNKKLSFLKFNHSNVFFKDYFDFLK